MPTSRDSNETSAIGHSEENGLADSRLGQIRKEVERCGGTLTCDEQGRPIEVDLVTGRVSADAAMFDALRGCPDVKTLRARLGQPADISFSAIASLTGLEELMLHDVAIDDNALIDVVGSLPHLRRLTLRNAPEVTDRAVVDLANRSALTHLALIDMQITGQSLKHITSMASLVFLDLRMCHGIRVNELAALVEAPELAELKVGGSVIDNTALAIVATLPHLRRLTIEDAAIDGIGLSRLTENKATANRLETLALARCSALSDDQLQPLKAFRKLRQLTVRDMPITGSFLAELQSSDQLELLCLNQTFLVEETFERIGDFRNLKRLELAQNTLTLQAMECLGMLSKLEFLNLSDCSISDDFLAPLAGLPNLKTIVVIGNPDVSREAVAKLLGHENP